MSQRLVKQKSIPGGEMEEADEEELVAVKRQATNLAVELESDDELKFEDPIEDADYQEVSYPILFFFWEMRKYLFFFKKNRVGWSLMTIRSGL